MKIKQLRETQGLLQKNVASQLGIAQNTYSQYESGTRQPDIETIKRIATYFNVTTDYLFGRTDEPCQIPNPTGKGIWVPVLGKVQAGVPIEAIEDIIDYEEIDLNMAATGEFFALQIRGDSMEPRIVNGDVVIVKKQPDVDSGDIAVVLINGDDATVKRIKKRPDGLMLIPSNPAFEPMFYSNKEIADTPISIMGKVVELRGKF